MSHEPAPSETNGTIEGPRTAWGVHWAAYGLLGVLLLAVLVHRYVRPLVLEEGISVAASRPAGGVIWPDGGPGPIDGRIDPNVASWPELARLPRIGETLARRIIEYRETQGLPADRTGPGGLKPVFTCPEDLLSVRGIGPKTLEQIAPLLKFPGEPAGEMGTVPGHSGPD